MIPSCGGLILDLPPESAPPHIRGHATPAVVVVRPQTDRRGPPTTPMRDQDRHQAPVGPAQREGYVYFIQAEDGGPVKIGTALDPLARLRALQTAHPAKLVIREILEGDLLGEAALHREFAPYHLRGEWFEPSWEIASWAAIKVGRHEPERPADLDAKLRAASKRIASRDRYELEDRQHFRKTAAERDRRIAADKRKQREREVTGPCGPLEIRFMTEGAE